MIWKPIADLKMLKARASLNSSIRKWFELGHYIEVEVPLIGFVPPTDPWLDCFSVMTVDGKNAGYLLPSPEPFLKRLLIAHPHPFFSITRGFRCGDSGKFHHPEFSILEWYRPNHGYDEMVKELGDFSVNVVSRPQPSIVTYRALFEEFLGLNPHDVCEELLAEKILEVIESPPGNLDVHSALDLLFGYIIEPSLENHIVIDFPTVQASQEKIQTSKQGDRVACRAELFFDGIEIANGYDELTDAQELRKRFLYHNRVRTKLIRQTTPPDGALIAAVSSGMPQTYGVALGVDRLLMILTKSKRLVQCLTFSSGCIRET